MIRSCGRPSQLLLSSCTNGRPKRYSKKLQHVTSHVFAENTYVVAPPHGCACVVPRRTYRGLYSKSYRNSLRGFWAPRGMGLKFAHSHYFGYWLLQQLGTTVQAVIITPVLQTETNSLLSSDSAPVSECLIKSGGEHAWRHVNEQLLNVPLGT